MSSTTHILARVRNIYASRHEPERLRPLSIIYWRAVLLFGLAGGLLILLGGAWEFLSVITTLNDTDTGVSTPTTVLDRTELQELLEAYDEDAAAFEALRASPPSVDDPSRAR